MLSKLDPAKFREGPRNPPLSKVREAFMAGIIGVLDPTLNRVFAYQGEVMSKAAKAGLLVDAGHLPDSVVRTIGKRGADLAYERAFDHPWGDRPWLLTHTWVGDGATGKLLPDEPSTLAAARLYAEARAEIERMSFRCYYLVEPKSDEHHFGAIVTEYRPICVQGLKPLAFWPIVRCDLTHSERDTFRTSLQGPREFWTAGTASSAVNPMMTTLMLMNTRGVRHSEHAAPTTRQVARKGGYVRLETAEYVTALTAARAAPAASGEGGHRRSPVPHLRRGHTRHLPDGRTTWVRDMLVNCASEGELAFAERHRVGYRVRGGTDAR